MVVLQIDVNRVTYNQKQAELKVAVHSLICRRTYENSSVLLCSGPADHSSCICRDFTLSYGLSTSEQVVKLFHAVYL